MGRAFDLLLLSMLLVPSVFAGLVVAALIYFKDGNPVLFRQRRIGLNQKEFELVKFRTMMAGTSNFEPGTDASRITKLGFFLRKFSIDELPSLWNVLKGEMSFVGPRPLPIEYRSGIETLGAVERHTVRPGVTGLAQVNGRNLVSWKHRFRYDLFFVRHDSFSFRLMLCLRTVKFLLFSPHADGLIPSKTMTVRDNE